MKKETLEEVAERLIPIRTRSTPFGSKFEYEPRKERKAFITGAKWQQERMYSEEDMNQYADYVLMCSAEKTFKLPLQPKDWFKQFKKK